MSAWPMVALGEVAAVERNSVDPSLLDGPTNYLGLEHIQRNGVGFQFKTVEAGELASSKFKFDAEHVLFGKLRPNLGKVVRPLRDGICSTDILPVRPTNKLCRDYLMYLLQWDRTKEWASRNATGANLPRLSPSVLAKLPIPLPPLSEQKRIAAILDKADGLRRQRRQALALLDTLTQSIFVEMFGDPMSNPKGWPECRLGEIIEFKGGSQPAKSHFVYEPRDGYVRLVQIRDFRTDAFPTYVPANLAKRPFEEDDVMVGRYGPPVFQILRGLSGTYNVALMKAEPAAGIHKEFVFSLLQEERLHSYVVSNSERTAGQSGVNLELLENYPAFRPSQEVQGEFAKVISNYIGLKEIQRVQLDHLDTLFASLQSRAFAGEL